LDNHSRQSSVNSQAGIRKIGYFASNKLKGNGGWDLYSFDLYREARPEEVIFLKGELRDEKTNQIIKEAIVV